MNTENTLYRWIDMPELPDKIGEYLVEYKNGKLEKIGYYPSPEKYFYYGTDNVNHLIKRWLSPIPEQDQEEVWKDVSFKIICGDDINELKQQYILLKKQ